MPQLDFRHTLCAALQDPSTVLLYDPPQVQKEPPALRCCVVIASSPNKKHFANFIHNPNVQLYKINPYTLAEAVEYFRLSSPRTSEVKIRDRFYQVHAHG